MEPVQDPSAASITPAAKRIMAAPVRRRDFIAYSPSLIVWIGAYLAGQDLSLAQRPGPCPELPFLSTGPLARRMTGKQERRIRTDSPFLWMRRLAGEATTSELEPG